MNQIEPRELQAWLAGEEPFLLDVRELWEVERCTLPGSVHVPMREIPARLDEISRSRPVVCICHHGARSLQVALFLEQRGFDNVFNLAGGIDAWSRDVDPAVVRY